MNPSRFLFVAIFLTAPWALAADQATALREALAAINAEQQAVYQQFQMLQSLRDRSQNAAYAPPPPGPPQNYDDVVEERQAAVDRAKRYQEDIDVLYARYQRLEEDKQPLLAQLRELALQPPRPAAPTAAAPAVPKPRPR